MKKLLRNVLDPAAETVQHAKQRERIINDNIYFTASKAPRNIPEWAYDNNSNAYETEYETDICPDKNVEQDDEEIFFQGSMETNSQRTEELGETSSMGADNKRLKLNVTIKIGLL